MGLMEGTGVGKTPVLPSPPHAHRAAELEVTKFSCFPTTYPQTCPLPPVRLNFLERGRLALAPLEKERPMGYPQPKVGGGEAWACLDLTCPSL